MSSRSNMMTHALRQKAVYWGGATSDGAAGRTFSDAVEIRCFWQQKSVLFVDSTGREVTSAAVVVVDRDLAVGGYLALGRLSDLTPAQVHDAFQVAGSREIRQFGTSRGLHDDAITVRRAWL